MDFAVIAWKICVDEGGIEYTIEEQENIINLKCNFNALKCEKCTLKH